MSLLKKALASIGIGSARVDTLVETPRVRPGGVLRGVVRMQGGQVAQEIGAVYLELMTRYTKETDDAEHHHDVALTRLDLAEPFVLEPGMHKELPFTLRLPLETPVTLHKTRVWLKTGLSIPLAVDPKDHDPLEVEPTPEMQAVLEAMTRLGFRLREVECTYAPRLGERFGFVQEFEFVPVRGPFRGRLDEVEVYFFPRGEALELVLQVDRRARDLHGLLEEAMGMDERFVRLVLRPDRSVAAQLEEAIRYGMRR